MSTPFIIHAAKQIVNANVFMVRTHQAILRSADPRLSFKKVSLSPEDAVRYAFKTVGRAIVVTTVILVIGFSILATSAFDMNASMGRMTAITLAVALLADFLLLPPLLMALDRGWSGTRQASAVLQPVSGD